MRELNVADNRIFKSWRNISESKKSISESKKSQETFYIMIWISKKNVSNNLKKLC